MEVKRRMDSCPQRARFLGRRGRGTQVHRSGRLEAAGQEELAELGRAFVFLEFINSKKRVLEMENGKNYIFH